MSGRRYSIDEALDFWLAGHAESMEVDDPDSVVPTTHLVDAWEHFGEEVDKALQKHLNAADYERIYDDEGSDSITSDVYATLAGHGIGIWDGRWGPYLSDAQIDALTSKLKKDLGKYVDDTGGGSLEEEFHNAVEESSPEGNPGRKRRYMTQREVKKAIQDLGMRGTYDPETREWRVAFKTNDEGSAYYTDDAEDAVNTARAMAGIKLLQRVELPNLSPGMRWLLTRQEIDPVFAQEAEKAIERIEREENPPRTNRGGPVGNPRRKLANNPGPIVGSPAALIGRLKF